ncbi:hypothetical protein NNO07_20325 [Pseudomonas resinovorans]|uniref:Uncharacterized protein n=1 Tax=Metapseudomonas resinovorans TaxID=53412 RepID=A0ABT4Y964_METRE|nr:hypothetical protein [Pseudomonas resinovorans]MDA8485420.1 hypothetical protein [Pseudomonas resinovorans]
MELLEDLFEQAALDVLAHGFASVSIRLPNPTRERIQHAGEFLLERAAESFPALDPYVSSNAEGTINLVLDRRRAR